MLMIDLIGPFADLTSEAFPCQPLASGLDHALSISHETEQRQGYMACVHNFIYSDCQVSSQEPSTSLYCTDPAATDSSAHKARQ